MNLYAVNSSTTLEAMHLITVVFRSTYSNIEVTNLSVSVWCWYLRFDVNTLRTSLRKSDAHALLWNTSPEKRQNVMHIGLFKMKVELYEKRLITATLYLLLHLILPSYIIRSILIRLLHIKSTEFSKAGWCTSLLTLTCPILLSTYRSRRNYVIHRVLLFNILTFEIINTNT